MITYSQRANASDEIIREVSKILATGRTDYQEYLFFRSAVHGTCVSLDGDIQSCESDEGIYHEALVHPAMLVHPNPRNVLVMGGGEGATAREVLRHRCVEKLVMVDIDKEFVSLCRRYIPAWSAGAFEDRRLKLHFQDINLYLRHCDERFDVVIGDLVDVHDWNAPVAGLYGEAFYARLKEHLNQGAIIATQGGPLAANDLMVHNRIRQALSKVFAGVASYGVVVPSFYHLWGFLLASDHPLPPDPKRPRSFVTAAADRALSLPALGEHALEASFSLPLMVQRALCGCRAGE